MVAGSVAPVSDLGSEGDRQVANGGALRMALRQAIHALIGCLSGRAARRA
jgi:hypothetical protein